MLVNLVVAAAENNVIGKNNQLLWRLPNDMAFFKNVTWGMPVIMGRKTCQSLGKPLKGRTNIVISRHHGDHGLPGIVPVSSLKEAVEAAAVTDAREAYVIGGGEIYRLALPQARRVYLTRVHASPEGDTFFPVLDPAEWTMISNVPHEADEKHAFSYSFQIWQRK